MNKLNKNKIMNNNNFWRTPENITEVIAEMAWRYENILDLCAGDGALTKNLKHLPNINITSVDLENAHLNNITWGVKVCQNILDDNFDIDEFSPDCIICNPPFDKYREFLNKIENYDWQNDEVGIFILPKRAIYELDTLKTRLMESIVFEKVKFTTYTQIDFTFVDIAIVKVNLSQTKFNYKDSEIMPICTQVNSINFLTILSSKYNLSVKKIYKGKFIKDSYTHPYEYYLTEWRTDFILKGDEYAVSTFFEHDYTPNFDEIIHQIWKYCEFLYNVGYENIYKSGNTHEYFFSKVSQTELSEIFEYTGGDISNIDHIRTLSSRFYQDSKILSLIDTQTFTELCNSYEEPI